LDSIDIKLALGNPTKVTESRNELLAFDVELVLWDCEKESGIDRIKEALEANQWPEMNLKSKDERMEQVIDLHQKLFGNDASTVDLDLAFETIAGIKSNY
jgi:hypothetical protein